MPEVLARAGLVGRAAAVAMALVGVASAGELREVEVEHLGSPATGSVFAWQVKVSPDGDHVYTIGAGLIENSPVLRAFVRAPDGSVSAVESELFGFESFAPYSLALTPDGRHLYASSGSDLLATFARDPSTGTLAPLETVFDVSGSLLASPDGRHVYATGAFLLATYTRDEATGALTRTDLENGVVGPAPIHQAAGLAISPDGRHVYLGSLGSPNPGDPGPSLSVFERDGTSGALEFDAALFQGEGGVDGLSYPSHVAVSGDGRNVYVSGSENGNADDVATFARDTASGALVYLGKADGVGFTVDSDGEIAVSPDGERVLVTGKQLVGAPPCCRNGVSIFRRDPVTGVLSHLETLLGAAGAGEGDLGYPTSIAFAPDGHDVFVTSGSDSALNVYRVLPRCSTDPLAGCRVPTRPGRSQIVLSRGAGDSLQWTWRRGEATSAADFGDPRSTTDYAFCLHRQAVGEWETVMNLVVPAAGICGESAQGCWRGVGNPAGSAGYVFLDPTFHQHGVAELRLEPGPEGHASILLRGRGASLDLPALPLPPSERVVAQLRTGDGACWSAEYDAPPLTNRPKRFADRSN